MFKSALIYQFTDGHEAPAMEGLEFALCEYSCGELMSQESIRSGFTPVCGGMFTFSVAGLTMFAVLTKSKEIPSSALAAEIRTRRESMERDLGRWLSSKEKFELKKDVISDLLPRAFTTEKTTRGYIDHAQRIIVIDTSSAARADDVLALLRKAVETLPVRAWEPDCDPRYVMTEWLRQQKLPVGFGQGYAVTLDSREDGEAKLKDISLLNSDEVTVCLNSERMVSKIALTFADVEFNLSDWMQLTGIKPLDSYKAQLDGENPEDRMATELLLFSGWIRSLTAAIGAAMAEDVTADDVADLPAEKNPVFNAEDEDPLYAEAVAFVVESRKVSVSGIQRKFRIGYNRSAYIVDAMERNGIVSEVGHNGSRTVLMFEVTADV